MRRTSLLLLSMVAAAAPAMAQARPDARPQHQPGAVEPRQEVRREATEDPAEATRLLNRSLQDLDQRRERVREAIQKIQQGTPVREALRGLDLRLDRGERREGGGGRVRGAEPGSLSEAMGQPGSRRLDHPPTAEERARARAFMREHLPQVADRMEAFEKANPESAERGLMRLIPRIEEAEAVQKSDPRLFGLRVREIEGQIRVVEAIRADREARESKDTARIEESTRALRAALAAQMDTRLELQEHEIASLTRQLEELKADVQKKRTNRDASIEDMLKRVREFGERRSRERSQGEKPKEGGEAHPPGAPKR